MAKATLYSPLDSDRKEFRLVLLEPGPQLPSNQDILKCTLVKASLLDDPEYETISYCWGDVTARSTIKTNGIDQDVPASSEAVLRRVRSPEASRVLWIDAICINQEDVAERSAQVAMMGDLYRSGKQNLVYFGEDDSHAESALRSIRQLIDLQIAPMLESGISLFDVLKKNIKSESLNQDPIPAYVDQEAVAALLSLKWFSRLWVVQEASLARRNVGIWGGTIFELQEIFLVSHWLVYCAFHCSLVETPGAMTASYIFEYRTDGGEFSFPRALDIGHKQDTTEERDRVFAVLSLYNDATSSGAIPLALLPDYSKPVGEIYAAATRFALAGDPVVGLTELLFVHHESNSDVFNNEMPSWVPHYDREWGRMSSCLAFNACKRIPSPRIPAEPLSGQTWRELQVKGFVIDKVTKVTPWHDASFSLEYFFDRIRDILGVEYASGTEADNDASEENDEAWEDVESRVEDESFKGHLCRTLMQGASVEDTRLFSPEDHRMCQYFLAFLIGDVEMVNELESQPEMLATVMGYIRHMQERCRGFSFCQTTEELIGSVPVLTEVGDLVVVVFGCTLPVVLRQIGNTCKFIGPAYIDGIMLGEAVDAWESFSREYYNFTLD